MGLGNKVSNSRKCRCINKKDDTIDETNAEPRDHPLLGSKILGFRQFPLVPVVLLLLPPKGHHSPDGAQHLLSHSTCMGIQLLLLTGEHRQQLHRGERRARVGSNTNCVVCIHSLALEVMNDLRDATDLREDKR